MGVAALRWQGRRHVVASMSGKALACLCLTRMSYPGQMMSYADRLILVDMLLRCCWLVALGPSPNHQPPAQTSLWSVPHSLYTGRPHTRAATRSPAPPRHLSDMDSVVPWSGV